MNNNHNLGETLSIYKRLSKAMKPHIIWDFHFFFAFVSLIACHFLISRLLCKSGADIAAARTYMRAAFGKFSSAANQRPVSFGIFDALLSSDVKRVSSLVLSNSVNDPCAGIFVLLIFVSFSRILFPRL